jgi:hypothetical protein
LQNPSVIAERHITRDATEFQKKGYFQDEVDAAVPEKDLAQETLMPDIQAASIQSRIALGERKGRWVRRMGFTRNLQAERTGRLCAQAAGFSLHAAVYCKPWERAKLEMLCRYITRPAVAEDRLELTPSGDVILRLKTPYADGTSHLLFSGVEFVEKLAALIPPARIHLTRFFGCCRVGHERLTTVFPQQVSRDLSPNRTCTLDASGSPLALEGALFFQAHQTPRLIRHSVGFKIPREGFGQSIPRGWDASATISIALYRHLPRIEQNPLPLPKSPAREIFPV